LYQADSLATVDDVTGHNPRHDSAGEQPSDQTDTDLFTGSLAGFDSDQHVFVVRRRLGFHGVEELPGAVANQGNRAGYRRILNELRLPTERSTPGGKATPMKMGSMVSSIKSTFPCAGRNRLRGPHDGIRIAKNAR
jgi:hypothetical protein